MGAIKQVMLQFGMLQAPVSITKATEERKKVSFNQGHKCSDGSLHVIKQNKVCTGCNKVLATADIIKLYSPAKGVAPIEMPANELESLKVQGTDSIIISEIIKPEILLANPTRFTGDSYYIQPPAKEKYPPQAYKVILEAIRGEFALGRTVLWDKDYQVCLRVGQFGLIMDMLRFDSELRAEPSLSLPPVEATWVTMAQQVRESLRVTVPTLDSPDTYNEALAKLCQDKVSGLPITVSAPAPAPVVNTNIEAMLKASLALTQKPATPTEAKVEEMKEKVQKAVGRRKKSA